MTAKLPGDARPLTRRRLVFGLTLLSSAACGGTRVGLGRTGDGDRTQEAGARASGGAGGQGIVLGKADAIAPTPPACDPGALDAAASAALAPYVVSHEDVGRRTLYSWTSAAQIEELRADPTLLTRSQTAAGERGRASDYIRNLAPSDEIAAILARPEFEKKRFGWPNAWSTALGWQGETYGDQLLEIRLRADAWVGRLKTSGAEWAFFDVDNNPVSLDRVKAEPERVGAVYFVDLTSGSGCSGTFARGAAYREYVICNERMIEEWSAQTPEIRQHLVDAISALGAFGRALGAAKCVNPPSVACFIDDVLGAWETRPKYLLGTYEASLAFPNELYTPTVGSVDSLVAQLQALLFDPAPLRHINRGDAAP
jgi:hypothetical protein